MKFFNLKCDFCTSLFKSQPTLSKHIELVHEKKKPYLCSYCDYACGMKSDLKKHVEAVHERTQSHKCPLCD